MKKNYFIIVFLFVFNYTFSQVTFTSSNLPIIVINTNNQAIPNEPKITVNMGIIFNGAGVRNYITDPFNNYNGKIGIEKRGNYAQSLPQKCYSIETRDAIDSALDVSLLGMPKESDWVLYAPYNDKSLLRNVITYKISNEMGNYASRTVFCELVLDGQYQGVYVLMEKIKRDKKRVDIAKLDSDDNAGDSLTGGYIFKYDWNAGTQYGGWTSVYGNDFQYHYPKVPTNQQKGYIKTFTDNIETALIGSNFDDPFNGYAKYVDVTSFIDFILMNEFTKNWDGYVASNYFHKEKINDGDKLKAGPIWDYNLSYGNHSWCSMHDTSGWIYPVNFCRSKMFWFERFMQDTNFVNKLNCRWNWMRNNVIPNNYLTNYIDSMALYLDESRQRHFTKWPILGTLVIAEPTPLQATFQGEINYLKTWIVARTNWMDGNMPGTCNNVGITENKPTDDAYMNVYPNPFVDNLNINYFLNETTQVQIQLINALGETTQLIDCGNKVQGDYTVSLNEFSNLTSGMYVVRVITNKKTYNKVVVK